MLCDNYTEPEDMTLVLLALRCKGNCGLVKMWKDIGMACQKYARKWCLLRHQLGRAVNGCIDLSGFEAILTLSGCRVLH